MWPLWPGIPGSPGWPFPPGAPLSPLIPGSPWRGKKGVSGQRPGGRHVRTMLVGCRGPPTLCLLEHWSGDLSPGTEEAEVTQGACRDKTRTRIRPGLPPTARQERPATEPAHPAASPLLVRTVLRQLGTVAPWAGNLLLPPLRSSGTTEHDTAWDPLLPSVHPESAVLGRRFGNPGNRGTLQPSALGGWPAAALPSGGGSGSMGVT